MSFVTVVGDLNGDDVLDGSDVDVICNSFGGPFSALLDFDGSGSLDYGDVESFVDGTLGTVIGDAWSDYLSGSKDVVASWLPPINCGNFNVKSASCSGQNY